VVFSKPTELCRGAVRWGREGRRTRTLLARQDRKHVQPPRRMSEGGGRKDDKFTCGPTSLQVLSIKKRKTQKPRKRHVEGQDTAAPALCGNLPENTGVTEGPIQIKFP